MSIPGIISLHFLNFSLTDRKITCKVYLVVFFLGPFLTLVFGKQNRSKCITSSGASLPKGERQYAIEEAPERAACSLEKFWAQE